MSLVHRRNAGTPRVGVPPQPSHRNTADSETGRSGPLSEREKYDKFIRANYDRMRRRALWLCHDTHLAEDLVQDAALKMWRICKSGRHKVDQLNFSYARRVIRNTFLDHVRQFQRGEQFIDGAGNFPALLLDGDLDENMTGHDVIQQVRRVVPKRHWEMYVLAEGYGFKPKEIAARLDVTPGTVSNYLSAARRLVKEEVQKLEMGQLSPF